MQLDFIQDTPAEREASIRKLLADAQANLAKAFRMQDTRAIGYWRERQNALWRKLGGTQTTLI